MFVLCWKVKPRGRALLRALTHYYHNITVPHSNELQHNMPFLTSRPQITTPPSEPYFVFSILSVSKESSADFPAYYLGGLASMSDFRQHAAAVLCSVSTTTTSSAHVVIYLFAKSTKRFQGTNSCNKLGLEN